MVTGYLTFSLLVSLTTGYCCYCYDMYLLMYCLASPVYKTAVLVSAGAVGTVGAVGAVGAVN